MNKARNSGLSLNLGNLGGIPIKIHFSFFLLLLWIFAEAQEAGAKPLAEILFVISIFGCVLLHELGHALMARSFGIRTRDIVLYPFGGVASILGEAKPKAELLIALAGPLVNVVIALMIYPFLDFPSTSPIYNDMSFLARLFVTNIVLVIFNMIPAFPMDGGRILRAALALLKIKNATVIATRISQVICILIGLLALYHGQLMLFLITAIVFFNALQEQMRNKALSVAEDHRVSDVMLDAAKVDTFSHGITTSQALNVALKSIQSAFPVLHMDQVLGVVDREQLLQTAALDSEDSYVSSIMDRNFQSAKPDETLASVFERIEPQAPLVIIHDGKFVGMLMKEKLLEYLLVHGIRKERRQYFRDSEDNSE